MPIPEDHLKIWGHRGAIETPQGIYNSVKSALAKHQFPLGVVYTSYLQGSYANQTNIYKDSDVDIVVELISTVMHDITSLSSEQQLLWHKTRIAVNYDYYKFRQDVIAALTKAYPQQMISEGKKAIKISEKLMRMPVDVVIAIQHRKFRNYSGPNGPNFVDRGITFPVLGSGQWVVNFPLLHLAKGEAKRRVFFNR